MQDLVSKLLDYSISPYEMVEYCRKEKNSVAPDLRRLVSEHNSAYVRLCSAWCLGEIGDKDAVQFLSNAYLREVEINVRTNIVWALLMIDPMYIDKILFESFLRDKYYVIPLIALKRISGLYSLQGCYDFLTYYKYHDNKLVRFELLRNIRSFRYSSKINNYLKNQLIYTDDKMLKVELIHAIGATNKTDSIDILIDYYNSNKLAIINDELIVYALTNAMLSLAQSKPYTMLDDLYYSSNSKIIKLKIIETLASAGGPKSAYILKKINQTEEDRELRRYINEYLDITKITDH